MPFIKLAWGLFLEANFNKRRKNKWDLE